jgi:dienelactone hydrolase
MKRAAWARKVAWAGRPCGGMGVPPMLAALLLAFTAARAQPPVVLPGTEPLTETADLARLTNAGWHAFLDNEIALTRDTRAVRWSRDLTSPAAYARSVAPNRGRLRRMLGAIDSRVPAPRFEIISARADGGPFAEDDVARIWSVRWPALDGVDGEGLLVRPHVAATALIVLVPDASETPDAFARRPLVRRLAASGAHIVIPALANRSARHAGDAALGIVTNQSQREWITRQAALTGRHILGYEVQKVLAALDALAVSAGTALPLGVAGWGEGGLLALHAAALDERIAAAWVGGHFQPREAAWREPFYRGLPGLLAEFGDAEVATLVAPRALVVEACPGPRVIFTPVATGPYYTRIAAPGEIRDAAPEAVRAEWQRARALAGDALTARFHFAETAAFGSEAALTAFWRELTSSPLAASVASFPPIMAGSAARERRTMRQLESHAQAQLRHSEAAREASFWKNFSPAQAAPLREHFAREAIGRIAIAATPARPRSRLLPARSDARFTTYEVVLDVAPGAITWGWLLLPADLRAGERRPVVVCQHGSGGLPADTLEENPAQRAHQIYQAYAARLAAEGFVVFAPYLPNRIGGDDYRLLARKASLLGLSFMSPVLASHERLLAWLRAQPFADADRIAIYGMSYGAKAAIRAVAALDGYAAAVFSGDFNDNAQAIGTVRHDRNEQMFYADYDLVEWDLAPRFNYAEMVALFAPRPVMVEFGYADRAVQLEGAAAEFAKVTRLYARLGAPERAQIEFFEGGHTVPGRGTFAFLRRWLGK